MRKARVPQEHSPSPARGRHGRQRFLRASSIAAIATALVACAAVAAQADAVMAARTVSCPGTLHAAPGVGDIIITEVRVRGVRCAQARPAIQAFERHIFVNPIRFRINGTAFRCSQRLIGSRETGLSRWACRRRGKLVTWRSSYGI